MGDDRTGGDTRLVQVMTRAAQRILAGERPYDVCNDATGRLSDLIGMAHHDGAAYVLWARISDLVDHPSGPQSEFACNDMARAVSGDWLRVDSRSAESVAAYFERWDLATGSAWLAQEAQTLATQHPRADPN